MPNSSENQNTLERKRRFSLSFRRVGRRAGEAVQLAERRRGQQVAVADDLVDDVGLGRVQRHGRVAHVLGRVEAAVGERAIELLERHQSPAAGTYRQPLIGSMRAETSSSAGTWSVGSPTRALASRYSCTA